MHIEKVAIILTIGLISNFAIANEDTRNLNQAHGSCLATVVQAGGTGSGITKAMNAYYERHNPRIKSLSTKIDNCMAGKIDNAANHTLCVKNNLNSSDADFYTSYFMILGGNNNLLNKSNSPSFLIKYCTHKDKLLLIGN
jgi:hypothetical protein